MSVEHKSDKDHERERSPEFIHDSEHSHSDRLRKAHDQAQDHSRRERDVAAVRAEALENATSQEDFKEAGRTREISPAERRGPITKKQLDQQFQHTMADIREDMSPADRTFSKLIHNKAVERTSDFLGATIARPNALLAGAVCAFILTLGVYLFAKNMGYQLSGSEPIVAFIIGWFIGQLYDYFKIMITGKKDL